MQFDKKCMQFVKKCMQFFDTFLLNLTTTLSYMVLGFIILLIYYTTISIKVYAIFNIHTIPTKKNIFSSETYELQKLHTLHTLFLDKLLKNKRD